MSNSWAFLNDDPGYASIVEEVYNLKSPEKALSLLDEYYVQVKGFNYEGWQESLACGKAAMIVARYCQDNKLKKEAKAKLTESREFFEKAQGQGAPDCAMGVANALWSSFSFLIFGDLGDGLNYTKLMDKTYKADNGEDIVVLINQGARYAYSPAFAGGSSRKALEILEKALANKDSVELGKWDEFGLYSSLGYAYDNQKNKDKALEFSNKAMALYTGDPYVIEIIEKYSK